MKAHELSKVIEEFDRERGEPFHPSTPWAISQLRATLEVAYQLAFLNEDREWQQSRSVDGAGRVRTVVETW